MTAFWRFLMSFISTNSVVKLHEECNVFLYTKSMSFGEWLTRKREQADLTQYELAERSGLSPSYISALERDEPSGKDGSPRRLRPNKIEPLAKALGVHPDEVRRAVAGASGLLPSTQESRAERLEQVLRSLGANEFQYVEGIDRIKHMSDEEFDDLLRDIMFVVELRTRNKESLKKP
jgi:transcriptional regulator with XRE-family HTH domain